MDISKRIVQFAYGAGTFLVALFASRLYGSIFRLVGARDPEILGRDFTMATLLAAVTALGALLWAWRHERIRPLAHEVADELTKVTWPTWDETKSNGRITVAVSVVVALILGVFDWFFGGLTTYILGGA